MARDPGRLRVEQGQHRELDHRRALDQPVEQAQFERMDEILGIVEHDSLGTRRARRFVGGQRGEQRIEAVGLGRGAVGRNFDGADSRVADRADAAAGGGIVAIMSDVEAVIVMLEPRQRRAEHVADHRGFVPRGDETAGDRGGRARRARRRRRADSGCRQSASATPTARNRSGRRARSSSANSSPPAAANKASSPVTSDRRSATLRPARTGSGNASNARRTATSSRVAGTGRVKHVITDEKRQVACRGRSPPASASRVAVRRTARRRASLARSKSGGDSKNQRTS